MNLNPVFRKKVFVVEGVRGFEAGAGASVGLKGRMQKEKHHFRKSKSREQKAEIIEPRYLVSCVMSGWLFDLAEHLINPEQRVVHDLFAGTDGCGRHGTVRAVTAFGHAFDRGEVLVVTVAIMRGAFLNAKPSV